MWSVARTDCVGFVMRYRARLLALGIPGRDMTFAVFGTPQGQHAALLVRWRGEVWKLDQREAQPVRWRPP